MDNKTILEKLQEIFRDVFGNKNIEISPETSTDNMEDWDSMMHISILAAVQDEFKIRFGLDEIVEMKSVGDIIVSIEGRQAQGSSQYRM